MNSSSGPQLGLCELAAGTGKPLQDGDGCHEIRRHVVANVERIQNVALHVKREVDAGNKVAVIVSAMSGVTNQLVAWVKEASPLYDRREYDAVVATGEQVTAGLLAISLQAMGLRARSWTGWQVPIKTSAAHGSARIAIYRVAISRSTSPPERLPSSAIRSAAATYFVQVG